jgi:hypothetical protein
MQACAGKYAKYLSYVMIYLVLILLAVWEAIQMSSQREDLKTMMTYFIGHNQEHSAEFVEWAEKAKQIGETEIQKAILDGVKTMDKANESFKKALKILEKKNVTQL